MRTVQWRNGLAAPLPGHPRPRAPAMPQCLFPMSAGCLVLQCPSNGVPSGEVPAQAIVVPIPCVVPLYVYFIEPTWIPIGQCVRPFLRTLSDRHLPRTGGDAERASFVGRQLSMELVARLVHRSNLLKSWDKTDIRQGRRSGACGQKNTASTRMLAHVLPRSRTPYSDRTALG